MTITSADPSIPAISTADEEPAAATDQNPARLAGTKNPGRVDQPIDGLPITLSVAEAAALLRVGRSLAYGLVHQWHATSGRQGLRSIRVGRSLRIPRNAIIEFIGTTPT